MAGTSLTRLQGPLNTNSNSSGSYTLTAQGGIYTITGGPATIERDRRLTASGGSYSLTGANATVSKNRRLTASGGSYTLTGQSATLLKSRTIQAQGGAYAYSGGQATIEKDRRLTASGGSYQVLGGDATITKSFPSGYVLTALGGEYQLTGGNASITVSGTVVVDTHDGFWANEQRKMWQWATKPPKLKEIIEVVKESPEQLINIAPEVKQAIVNKYPDIDYSQIANNAQIIRFIAEQLLVQIEKRRIEIENDEEEATLLLM